MKWVVAAFALAALGATIGFWPELAGRPWMWLGLAAGQVPLATVALRRWMKNQELREVLQPQWGDISLGMGSALALLTCTFAARFMVAGASSPQGDWLAAAYRQAGARDVLEHHWMALLAAVLVVAALEELVWRGVVLAELEELVGTRRAWPLTGLLYGLSFAPSVWLLRGAAGPNPLVVAAAVLGGVTWSYLAARTRRLVPSILSHAVYLWFVVAQFRLLAMAG